MNVLPQKFMIAIWLFLTTGVYSSEGFQIQRKNSDVFTIPPSQCKATNSDCSKYNALRGVTSCSCYCDAQNATFAFYENSWKCVGNEVVRRLLGCHKRTFFQNETPDQQLQVVNYVSPAKYLSSTLTGRCAVNLAASRNMNCHGNVLSLGGTIPYDAFEIVWDATASTYKLQFDLPNEKPLQGQIINLSIQCSGATADECLLFKMTGTTNCRAPLTTNVKTTISMIDGKSTEPLRLSSLSTSTEVKKVPGAESDRNSGAIISTSIVALIAGINGFLVLVILVIGLCIYHRQRSRSYPLTSVPSGTLESPLSSLETQNGQQNADYATLTPINCGSPTYNNGDDTVINFNSSGRCPRVDDAGYAKVGSPCGKEYAFLAPGPERTRSEYQRLVKPGEDDSGYLLPMEERAPRIPAATGGPSTTDSLINSEAQNPSAQDRPKDKEYDYAKPENLICLTVSRSTLENLDLDTETDPSYVDKRVEDKETTDNGPSSPFYATVEVPSSPGSPSEEGPLGDTPEEAPVKKDLEDLIPEYLELLPDTGSESGTSLRAENSKA